MNPRARILCIEDEDVLRGLIAAELRDSGYEVEEAADGPTGLRMAVERKPDLVLCDITMPGADGYEVLTRLRADHPELAEVPFVFLSAFADRKDVIAGKKLGADDYLTKPVDFEVMHATIEARLRQVAQIRSAGEKDRADARERFQDILSNARRTSFDAGAEALHRLAIGIVLLDADRQVVFANRTAENIVRQKDALLLRHGRLHAALSAYSARLESLIQSVTVSPSNSSVGDGDQVANFPRLSGQRAILVLGLTLKRDADAYSPEKPVALLLLSDPERRHHLDASSIARLYDLTLAEARLAQGLAAGTRLDDVAQDLGISRNTATTHLKRIFQKTSTERQAELVALLVAGPLGISGLTPSS